LLIQVILIFRKKHPTLKHYFFHLPNVNKSIFIIVATLLCCCQNTLVFSQIEANFNSNVTEACNSLQTTFFDQSTSDASIIDWSWNLDGNTSLEQNPGAIFSEPGQYTICLTVTDVNGNSDTQCKEDYITIFPNPIANFTIDNNEGCAPIDVLFSDASSSQNGNITSWLWDVGGSAGVVEQTMAEDFTSSYAIQGFYTSSLTVVDEKGCIATTSIPNAVIASSIVEPLIDIELVPSCTLPWDVKFTNLNIDPNTIYSWDFGNGQTFIGTEPPLITYTDIGIYDITLYLESGDCTDTFLLEKIINTNSTASFTYGPSSLCQNGPISFIDNSIIEADEVIWMFGDGTTSIEANPSHTYTDPGCYDVTLIRTSGSCVDSTTVSCIEIIPEPILTYDIVNQFNCDLPTEVILQASANTDGSFEWQFSNATTTVDFSGNNIPVTIENFGKYYASFIFTSDDGCSNSIDSILIDIAPFDVDLPVIGPSGCAPLTFSLTDSVTTQSPLVSWQWSIGEPFNMTSNSANPTFTIQDTGRYDVQLIVENANGCVDTVMIEDYIRVGNKPIVDFEGDPLIGCLEEDKFFTNLSTGAADSWEWFFGDDGYSNIENPLYNFTDPGDYDVALYVSHNGCTDSLRKIDYIRILEPRSLFAVEYNCENPYTVNIINRSRGADSLFWTLSLSDTEEQTFTDSIFGSYTFDKRGEYVLSHYSYSYDTECEHIFTDTIKIVDPKASYTLDTLRGCAPLELKLNDDSQDAFTYEYLTDIATIDTFTNSDPLILFNEGGIITGPTLIITDIHECKDTFQLSDSLYVNKLEAKITFDEVICIPDYSFFIDSSETTLSTITGRTWTIDPVDFMSNDQSTSYLFDSVGFYDVSFFVEDDWGCKDSLILSNAINAINIEPDFKYDSLGCTWAPIQFFGLNNENFIGTYEWEFGDGNTSLEKNPTHIYNQEGVYSVCLTMYDSRGCSKTHCKDNIITILDPVAEFTGDPIFATCPPLLSDFQNNSSNASQYVWDFGDNSGRSINTNPSHVYTSPGKYDVFLIAQSSVVCKDTLILEEYVVVEGPSGSFVADVSPTCIPVDVKLTAQSDDFYTYVWDLGNGILDSVPGLVINDTILYAYDTPGRYTPKLIITDDTGCSRSFAGMPIDIDKVEIDFTVDQDTVCGPPLTLELQNLSTGSTDDVSYNWLISGPETITSSEQNPSIDISLTGGYGVNLIASYNNCVDTVSQENFLEVGAIPDISFDIVTDELCEDVFVEFSNNSQVSYGEIVEWYWDFGDGTTSTEENPSHKYSGLNAQTITLSATTDRGCQGSFTSTFEVLPSTIANAPDDETICIGDQIILQGTVENLQEEGDFYWEENTSLTCTDCYNPIANPTETTTYIFVAVHPNGCEFGCRLYRMSRYQYNNRSGQFHI